MDYSGYVVPICPGSLSCLVFLVMVTVGGTQPSHLLYPQATGLGICPSLGQSVSSLVTFCQSRQKRLLLSPGIDRGMWVWGCRLPSYPPRGGSLTEHSEQKALAPTCLTEPPKRISITSRMQASLASLNFLLEVTNKSLD